MEIDSLRYNPHHCAPAVLDRSQRSVADSCDVIYSSIGPSWLGHRLSQLGPTLNMDCL